MTETIKTYQGNDFGVSQCLVTLECFVGDVDNAVLEDDSTFDTSDAVTAINGLVWSLERREERMADMLDALREAEAAMSIIPPRNMKRRYLATLDSIRAAIAKAEAAAALSAPELETKDG